MRTVFVVIEIPSGKFVAVYGDYDDIPTRYTKQHLYAADNRYDVLEEKVQ